MAYGYNGRILRVNLTKGEIWNEEKDEKFYRKYLGGPAFGSYFLLNELKKGIDPLGKENILVFAAGLLTGSNGPAVPRYTVMAKSPLTGTIGKSEAGGFWGPHLKMAGFDAIIIEGKAEHPCYIFVEDGQAEIRSATHLWGRTTAECRDILCSELGDDIKIAQIGPGAEYLVRYANICNELAHFNGRNGLGAVMGSKNLKAIVVKRKGRTLPCYEDEKVRNITRFVASGLKDHPLAWGLYNTGTPGGIVPQNAAGALPTNNWQKGTFDKASDIGADAVEEILVKRKGCYSCPIRCKRVVECEEDGISISPDYGGPEYETLAALGSNLGIGDVKLIAKANELCNAYTLDTISLGMTLSFAMDCYEKGIITSSDTGGMELRFGNHEILLPLIEMIAYRKGFGALLAEGSSRMARIIGKEAENLLLEVKGQEVPMHDPRLKAGMALQYALSSHGADHWNAQHDHLYKDEGSLGLEALKPLGIYDAISATDLSWKKVRAFYYTHIYNKNSLMLWRMGLLKENVPLTVPSLWRL